MVVARQPQFRPRRGRRVKQRPPVMPLPVGPPRLLVLVSNKWRHVREHDDVLCLVERGLSEGLVRPGVLLLAQSNRVFIVEVVLGVERDVPAPHKYAFVSERKGVSTVAVLAEG